MYFMTREELITSREFWIVKVGASLWNGKNSKWLTEEMKATIADEIVDEYFMEVISEIRDLYATTPKQITKLDIPAPPTCVHDWTQSSLQWNRCVKCGMFVPVGQIG